VPAAVEAASAHFIAHREALRQAARLGPVVDLACGRGRHCLASAGLGLPVVGIDRNAGFLRELLEAARAAREPVDCVRADLETPHGLPLMTGSCGAILVFRFLFRPLAPGISRALVPGGLLLYETFTIGQLAFPNGPRNRDYLLEPGELPRLFPELEVISHSEGVSDGPKPWTWARLAARRPASVAAPDRAPRRIGPREAS
jgi:SAM-dependent methyltransferase